MKPKIVFLDEYSLAGRDLSAVKALGDYTGYDMTAPDEVAVRCADAEIVVTNKVRLDAATIAQLPHLRLICVAATGVNNIDLDAAAEHGVEVRNAVGYSTHSVAETTLGAAIALLRESVYYDEFFKSGRYARSPRLFCFDRPIRQLHGRRWGVIGLGAIGREVARLAAAFGCEVNYHSTSGVAREEAYPALPLDELLAWADVVSIHCPLNAHTRGLIGAEQLRRMKPSALARQRRPRRHRRRSRAGRSARRRLDRRAPRSTYSRRSRSRPTTRCSPCATPTVCSLRPTTHGPRAKRSTRSCAASPATSKHT